MFDLNGYIENLITDCQSAFGERLLYVGLQGSFMRGEATEDSDIDVMVVIDRFSVRDMDVYRGILDGLGERDRSCGFICGRDEMVRWTPLEACHLRHATRDLYGALADLLPEATRSDEIEYVRFSLGNLYHELCHRYIHADREKSVQRFRASCKALFFLIQNLHYLESGDFIATKAALMDAVSAEDREMLSMAALPEGYDFDRAFASVFGWCQNAFIRVGEMQ